MWHSRGAHDIAVLDGQIYAVSFLFFNDLCKVIVKLFLTGPFHIGWWDWY